MKTTKILLILLLPVATLGYGVFNHEYTHKTLAENRGCNASITVFNAQPQHLATTYTDCPPHVNTDQHNQIQDTVEAVGYQTLPLYMLNGLIIAFLLVNRT